jgi:hypothetical protein
MHPLKHKLRKFRMPSRTTLDTATRMERMAAGNISFGSFSSHGS